MSEPGSPLSPSPGIPEDGAEGVPEEVPEEVVEGVHEVEHMQKAPKSKVISWMLWDVAGASFNAVATTFVFAIYLTTDGLFASTFTANQYLSIGKIGRAHV